MHDSFAYGMQDAIVCSADSDCRGSVVIFRAVPAPPCLVLFVTDMNVMLWGDHHGRVSIISSALSISSEAISPTARNVRAIFVILSARTLLSSGVSAVS